MEISNRANRASTDREAGRAVRVSYVPQGFGLVLAVDPSSSEPATSIDPGADPGADSGDHRASDERGVLTVGDAVVTLEIPRPGGGWSTLAWDPAEVALDPLVA